MSNDGSPPSFHDLAEQNFQEALKRGLPAFLTSVQASTPVNATPYLTSYANFRSVAARWPGRSVLLETLESVRKDAGQYGLTIEAMLIGGSFAELSNPAPNDVDCLMFYRWDESADPERLKQLASFQQSAKQRKIDVRFIPLDGDPLVLIKIVSYFTLLYSKHKADDRIVRASILTDCRPSTDE